MEYGKIDEPHFVVCLEGAMKSMTALLPLLKKSTSPLEGFRALAPSGKSRWAFFTLTGKNIGKRNFTASRKSFPSQELSICFRKSPMDILISPLAGKGQYMGSHMVSGVIGITAKIIVTCFNTIIMREKDESMGFNMWKLSKKA